MVSISPRCSHPANLVAQCAGTAGDRRYRLIRRACALVGVPYFRPRIRLATPLPSGPFLVACNHTTMLDWAAIAYAIPRPVRFLITRDYYNLPYFRWFCRMGGAIPVRHGRIEATSFRRALAVLEAGEIVGIFPEGRISPDGRLLPFQRGVADLALRAHCAVVPATIRGAFQAFPGHKRFPQPRRVEIAFGSAIVPEQIAPHLPHGERSTALTVEIRARVADLASVPFPRAHRPAAPSCPTIESPRPRR